MGAFTIVEGDVTLRKSDGTEVGTGAAPLRVDPTGTTPQPVTDGGGSLTVDGPLTDAQLRAAPVPVSAASLPLPAGASTEATLALVKAKTDNLDVALSTRAEKAQLPAALVGGRLDANNGAWLGSTAPTVGQKTRAASLPVTLASDQPAIPVTFTPANARTGVSSAFLALGGGTAGTLQVMRSTPYVEPTSAAQRSLVSASANDAAAGTGARTVTVTYFDGTGAGPFEETVTLNGTTPVNMVATNLRFVEKMEVATVGALGANAGVIALKAATGGGGVDVGSIGVGSILSGVGDNITLWAHHYTPVGWTVQLAVFATTIVSGGSGTSAKFLLRARHPLISTSAEITIEGVQLVTGSFQRAFQFQGTEIGFVRVVAYVIPSVNNTDSSVAFDWSEVPS